MEDEDLTHLPMHRRARRGLGYLPQEASIFRKLTVRQNFLAVLELQKGLDRKAREARAQELIDEFGLGHVADALGETLSGGERRRAEIARSLIPNPRFILFDEPFAGVDPINVGDLQRQIALLKQRGLGVLITDHNVQDTLRHLRPRVHHRPGADPRRGHPRRDRGVPSGTRRLPRRALPPASAVKPLAKGRNVCGSKGRCMCRATLLHAQVGLPFASSS